MSTSPGPAQAPRQRKTWLWVGVGLVAVGVVGLVVLAALGPGAGVAPYGPFGGARSQTFGSLGERIFLTGTDAQGNVIPRSTTSANGMMFGQAGCAGCHGRDGRGGTIGTMMGTFKTPDIRWATLTSTQGTHGEGQAHRPYDQATFARAIRDGVDPEGDHLDPPMPQWRLTDAEVAALVTYLKTLR